MVNIKILKKNHIIISVIALMLITAGYFNYIENIDIIQTMSNDITEGEELAAIGEAKLVDSSIESSDTSEEQNEMSLNDVSTDGALVKNDSNGNPTSDAENVESGDSANISTQENTASTGSINTGNVDDYFASSRLERNNMYSEMISTYERMI